MTVYGPNRSLTTGTLAINYITEKAIFEIKKSRKRTNSISKLSIDQMSSLSAPRALAVSVGLTLVSPLNYIFLPFHIAVALTFFFIGKDYIDPYVERYPFMKAILAEN